MPFAIYWCQPCTFLCLTLDEASDEEDQDESDEEGDEKGDEEGEDTVECNENGDEEGSVKGEYSGGEMEQTKDLYREVGTVVTQTVTKRLSCDKPDDDKKFDSKPTRSDGETDRTAKLDVNVTDGTEENENTEHEGGTIETSAATSVVTGKNVCHTAAQCVWRSRGVVKKCVGRAL